MDETRRGHQQHTGHVPIWSCWKEAHNDNIYTVSQERFGFEEKNWIEKQSIPQPNRLQRQIKELRQRLRVLRKQYNKTTSNIEKIGLQHLRDIERQHLTNITKAENIRKKRKAKSKMRSPFTANPFRFTKSLLEEEKLGKPDCSMEDIESSPTDTRRRTKRHPFGRMYTHWTTCRRTRDGDGNLRTNMEGNEGKARSGSAPGPNWIPYTVYKMCA